MESDEGWEDVYNDNCNIKIDIKEKIKKRDIKLKMISNIFKLIKELKQDISVPEISEFIDFNVITKMYQILNKDKNLNQISRNIKYYKYLQNHKIYSRIYFVICNDKINSFLEIYVNSVIIKHDIKYHGVVFYIDNFNLVDYSWYFSSSLKNYLIFKKLIEIFNNCKSDMKRDYNIENRISDSISAFQNLDAQRLKVIPSSIHKFIHHPKYCLESILRYNQILKNKKEVCGFYKGEPVYFRNNIINLKSRKYFYKIGKEPTSPPLKIHNEHELYSYDQVKDIYIEDMNDKLIQDFIHINHIPKKCVYIQNEYDELVCRKLNIKYRKCFIGFNRNKPMHRGVFVYKKDTFVLSNFIFEYFDFYKKNAVRQKGIEVLRMWNRLVRMCRKYEMLKNRLK